MTWDGSLVGLASLRGSRTSSTALRIPCGGSCLLAQYSSRLESSTGSMFGFLEVKNESYS